MKLMKHPSLTNPEGRKLLGQDACCARPLLVRCTKTVPLPQTDRQPGRQAQTETETERERCTYGYANVQGLPAFRYA